MCSFMVNLLLSKLLLMLTFTVHLTVEMSQPYYSEFSIILWNTCMVHSLPIMKLNHSHHYGFAVHFACHVQVMVVKRICIVLILPGVKFIIPDSRFFAHCIF